MIKDSLRLASALLIFPCVFLLASCGGGTTEPLTYCNDQINTASPVLSNGFGFNLSNTRHQTSAINASNVSSLSFDFSLNKEDTEERRGAPAVTDQTIYYHTPSSVDAVNRETGCIYWSYEAPDRVRSASVTLVDEPTLKKRIIVVGTWEGLVIALDAKTGAEVWQVDAKEFDRNMITGGIQYHDGKLYVPMATKQVILAVVQLSCCDSHGSLVALNSSNGSEVWRYHTTDEADRSNLTSEAPNGVSIWSTPMLDIARNQILVGSAQNLTQPTTDTENAVIALNMDSGSVNWIFQTTPNDAYNATCDLKNPIVNHCDGPDLDWDVITTILTKNSQGEDIIIAGDKKGSVYQLDPANGHVFWETRLGAGGKLGGIHWAMAVDDSQIYAGIADVTAAKSSVLDSALGTDLWGWSSLEVPMIQVANAMPGIYALNKDTGVVNWSRHDTHFSDGMMVDSIYSAGVTVTNDVLFAASLDGVVKAFRTADGEELWQYNTAVSVTDVQGRQGNGGTVESVGPVIAGDNMLLNSGYNTFGGTNEFQAGPGNALFVFKLP